MLVGEQTDVRACGVADIRSRPDLVAEHYAEVEPEVLDRVPDWDTYVLLEQAGSLLVYGAFVDSQMVGYVMAIVGSRHLHWPALTAHVDSLYVAPAHRGHVGRRLLRTVERVAAARAIEQGIGRCAVSVGARAGSELARMLPALGYGEREVVYLKEIP